MSIKLLHPNIFPKDRIISGVTLKNQHLFPKTGLTFTPSPLCTKYEVANYKKMLAVEIGVDYNKLKFQHQIHSDIIRIIDQNSDESDSDGMITNEQGLILCVKIADCAAILVYDPTNQAIAAIHSGWRGTKQNIVAKAISKMSEQYGSRPEDIKVYLSPCSSGKKYEVGEEVAELFPRSIEPIGERKYLYDNLNEILLQLGECGILTENIETSGICTIENKEFHSYRRDRARSGRMCAYIGMND